MKTLKQKVSEHAMLLDAKFVEKYPDGRFTFLWEEYMQVEVDGEYKYIKGGMSLFWSRRRHTSHASPNGVGVNSLGQTFRHLSWNMVNRKIVKYFATLEAMKRYAIKKGLDERVIEDFETLYRSAA